jgi:predicted ArsR family transcriptional regulator
VELLRRSAQTVNDLAARLDLTDNAIRLHVSALERDGLVEQSGTRREAAGKPAHIYRTTGEAEALFPKPYDRVLGVLLTVLAAVHPPEEVERRLRDVGKRLAAGRAGAGDLRERAAHAAAVLTGLGGLAEVEEDSDGLLVRGYSCPLGALTTEHPTICSLAETLVSELMQTEVVECCDRGDRPRCAFRVVGAA